jgi:hypothetical protein
VEQPAAELRFERGHLPAQHGLRQAERGRGPPEAAVLGHAAKGLQGLEFHPIIRFRQN